MKSLIDEDLPRSIAQLLKRYGHETYDVRDVGLRGAGDSDIAAYAQGKGLCIITGDYDFADIRNYPPEKYAGIIVLSFPNDASVSFILSLLEGFLKDEKLVSVISGKLAIVEPGQIRIRKN